MSNRQTRRQRRRTAPASTLPRPVAAADIPRAPIRPPEARGARRQPPGPQVHHLTTDYSYVLRDLAGIVAVTLVTLGFILAMWLIV